MGGGSGPVNAGVGLVQAYLHLNGYFTVPEFPVIAGIAGGRYESVTDVDLLAVRLPLASHVVSRGRPGRADDLRLQTDPVLAPALAAVDVLVAEVKEGKARLNDATRTARVIESALTRVGCVPDAEMEATVEALRTRGEATVSGDGVMPARIRLVAFGDGESAREHGYHVISLRDVAEFVERHLERYHDVLHPADLADPVLALLHLLRKLR